MVQDWKDETRAKRDEDQKNVAAKQGEFKSDKEKTLKLNFDDETNWNYLFVNQDTVATSMAKKLGMQKSELFGQDSTNIAVKMAQSETIIINATKEWMNDHGMNVDELDKIPRSQCQRSKTMLLVKNIPYSTKEKELHSIFERYGSIKKLAVSPFNTVAIVEYETEKQARAAAKNLAYYKVNYIMPIYLEFAPLGMMAASPDKKEESDDEDQK